MHLRRPKLLSATAALTAVLLGSVSLAAAPSQASPAPNKLSNGCSVSTRGIPSCGAYVGAAYKANGDVTGWEKSMGKHLGVHRTYWSAGQVNSAVRTAKADAAANRIPWMSFAPPYSWSDMAHGKGDAWAKDLATKMKSVDGPVWIAVKHEPEGDGDISQWKAMQVHLAPLMRSIAPNLGYSVILMGYHEFYGASQYRMANIWPKTKIDVAGFDIYEKYGVKKSGHPRTMEWKNFKKAYFGPLQSWSQSTGVPWGLAETGYSDPAASANPQWMSQTYQAMKDYGGIAFSYFNTGLHSQANWTLDTSSKQKAFTAINKTAPTVQ
jgi:hypothetical protein